MSRASALGTVPRKTKRNETSQDKHNDNLLSERLKQTGLGTGKFDTSNLTGCVRHSHQTAVVPKAFVTLLVDKFSFTTARRSYFCH